MARQLRMRGYNVLMPMGWDAFGMPAENAAIKSKVPPAKWTYDNIAYMKKQMKAMGLAIDWSREMCACDPQYYKWNQWLFLKMLERAWPTARPRSSAGTRWTRPCWPTNRSSTAAAGVPARPLKARDPGLLPAHHRLRRRTAGRGAERPARLARARAPDAGKLDRQVRGPALRLPAQDRGRRRPADPGRQTVRLHHPRRHHHGRHLLRGRPEHPLATHAAASNPGWPPHRAMQARRHDRGRNGHARKEGMPTGLYVTHPITGAEVEVWVGNYVLMTYGDGAVMGVPAHDERDFAFARKYQLPIRQVVAVAGRNTRPGLAGMVRRQAVRPDDQFRQVRRPVAQGSRGRHRRRPGRARPGREADHLAPARLGHLAPALLGHPIPIIHCPDCGRCRSPRRTCRWCCPTT